MLLLNYVYKFVNTRNYLFYMDNAHIILHILIRQLLICFRKQTGRKIR